MSAIPDLKLFKNLALPADALMLPIALLGNRGSGKTPPAAPTEAQGGRLVAAATLFPEAAA